MAADPRATSGGGGGLAVSRLFFIPDARDESRFSTCVAMTARRSVVRFGELCWSASFSSGDVGVDSLSSVGLSAPARASLLDVRA